MAAQGGAKGDSVHPRGCGEHAQRRRLMWHWVGSSPRMRGTLKGLCLALRRRRFIPADAGNTEKVMKLIAKVTVHPRGCGEHVTISGETPSACRFIPADAGNTT